MYYLAKWIEDDSTPDELDIRPGTPGEASFAAIDLRGSDAAQAGDPVGYCIVDSRGEDWSEIPGQLWKLTDDHKQRSRVLRRRLSNLLSFNFADKVDLGQLLLEWYLNGDDAQGGKPNVLQRNAKRSSYGIYLAGETLAEIPALAGGGVMSDNFNRANGAVGADWTKTSDGSGVFNIASNELEQGTTGGIVTYYAYTNDSAATDSQYCQVKIAEVNYNQNGPQVRMLNSAANSSGYMAYWQGASADIARIRYTNTAAFPSRTTLTSDAAATAVADDAVIRIEVDGSALSWWHDGTELTGIATTDTTYAASSTRRTGGLYLYQFGVNVDDWEFGDLLTVVELGGDIDTTATLTAPAPDVVVNVSGDVTVDNTLAGDIRVRKTIAGDVDTSVTLDAPAPDRVANLTTGNVAVNLTGTGDLEVATADLGGLVDTDVTLTGEMRINGYLTAGEVATTSTLTGKMGSVVLAQVGEEAAIDTFVTLTPSGPLRKTVKLGGNIPVASNLTFGEPITLARMWDGTSWVPCWITTRVTGTWKRGQLRIWDGAVWQG